VRGISDDGYLFSQKRAVEASFKDGWIRLSLENYLEQATRAVSVVFLLGYTLFCCDSLVGDGCYASSSSMVVV
jgi:hypothetical protein